MAEIAARQRHLVTRSQLRSIGMAHSTIDRHVGRGQLFRVHASVFSIGGPPTSQEERWLAAALAVAPHGGLSHLAMAALWDVWKWRVPRIDVSTMRRQRRLRRVHVHSSRTLERRDVTVRRGTPGTTLPRTLLDIGDLLMPEEVTWAIHEAEFRHRLRWSELEEHVRRNPGRAATGVLRRALELRASGSSGLASRLERAYFLLVREVQARGGTIGGRPLVDPRINTHVHLPDGGAIRVDFHWPERMLVVEVDGNHDRDDDGVEDQARDPRLRKAGWCVKRCPPEAIRILGVELVERHLAA